jgi:hypothetical protein
MPLLLEENKILTKVLNVTESDGFTGRQQILLDMFTDPEQVELLFIKYNKIYVIIGNKQLYLGDINSKYHNYIKESSFIRKWKITGGYKLPDCRQSAYFGINIEIKL